MQEYTTVATIGNRPPEIDGFSSALKRRAETP